MCNIHGKEYADGSVTFHRQWEYGRLYGEAKDYRPKKNTIPYRFMVRIASEGPLRGRQSYKDGQPATNLHKAELICRTTKGFILTAKGKRFLRRMK